jgi:hypothetical protein
MAQTKRRRQSKHRGNAAGVVESRGRTGRKPTAAEKGDAAAIARAKREAVDKRDRPPTWRGAFVRAMIAAILFLLAVVILFNRPSQAVGLFPIVLLLYTPVSYYTDRWIYNRRQRSKAAQAGGAAKR